MNTSTSGSAIEDFHITLTENELASGDLRYERARSLVESGAFGSVEDAQYWLALLASRQRGELLSAELEEVFDAGKAALVQVQRVTELRGKAVARQRQLDALIADLDRLIAALAHEEERLNGYAEFEKIWRTNYRSRFCGNAHRHPRDTILFFQEVCAERVMIQFLRDECIPQLKSEIAAKRAEVEAFRSQATEG
jgi:hypothetical protein